MGSESERFRDPFRSECLASRPCLTESDIKPLNESDLGASLSKHLKDVGDPLATSCDQEAEMCDELQPKPDKNEVEQDGRSKVKTVVTPNHSALAKQPEVTLLKNHWSTLLTVQ
ncbi:hypothetical protein QVD17_15354 [Tagetes erecta]|uniref:Uncharacterized protein n=1 Tax=Tagetes erecta TaxID=13708 RepID=A0AAD8NZG5_TARER|nr:hypothetical protein QVD17_15354 [Tagetes erecta]